MWAVYSKKKKKKLREKQLKLCLLQTAIKKPHNNYKTKVCNRYTKKQRKRSPNITLKIAINSQENQ